MKRVQSLLYKGGRRENLKVRQNHTNDVRSQLYTNWPFWPEKHGVGSLTGDQINQWSAERENGRKIGQVSQNQLRKTESERKHW